MILSGKNPSTEPTVKAIEQNHGIVDELSHNLLSLLLQTHGVPEVLAAIADVCDARLEFPGGPDEAGAHKILDDWNEQTRLIRALALQLKGVDEHPADFFRVSCAKCDGIISARYAAEIPDLCPHCGKLHYQE